MKENSQETSHGKWEEKCLVAFGKLHACGLWADKSKSDNKETKLKKHACWNISLSVKEKVLQKELYSLDARWMNILIIFLEGCSLHRNTL
jgi:hypothetical protein